MYLKNGLAERRVGGRDGGWETDEYDGEGQTMGRTHFRAHAYLSQEPQQV